jgi:hypothetical protein
MMLGNTNLSAARRMTDSPSHVQLRWSSKAWIILSMGAIGTVAVLVLALAGRDGIVLAALWSLLLVPHGLCLRTGVGIDDDRFVIRNPLRTYRIPVASVAGITPRIGWNVGMTFIVRNLMLRRKVWRVLLHDGSSIPVFVFTEFPSFGAWNALGGTDAVQWWRQVRERTG